MPFSYQRGVLYISECYGAISYRWNYKLIIFYVSLQISCGSWYSCRWFQQRRAKELQKSHWLREIFGQLLPSVHATNTRRCDAVLLSTETHVWIQQIWLKSAYCQSHQPYKVCLGLVPCCLFFRISTGRNFVPRPKLVFLYPIKT